MPNKMPASIVFLIAIILIVGLACSLRGVGLRTAPTTSPNSLYKL